MRARGVRWCCLTASSEAISSAPAPTEICEATAAVSSQPSRSGLRPAIFSSEVSGAAPSSLVTPAIGAISRSNWPLSMALTARRWLSSANCSRSPRLKPHFSHMSCAPRNWEISWSPYRSVQPSPYGKGMPFSRAIATLEPIGTMPMFSTPEATTRSWVPDSTPWAAKWMACCDEPHCRSMVTPGTRSGSPADSHAVRAMSRDCGPTCMTQPMITSSTASGSTPVRSTSS